LTVGRLSVERGGLSVERGDCQLSGAGGLRVQVGELAAELGLRLSGLLSSKKLDQAFAAMDPDGDGEVTFEEFSAWCVMPARALGRRASGNACTARQ
jgi:hypothetical protein